MSKNENKSAAPAGYRPSGRQMRGSGSCKQCGMPGGGHKMQCGERAHERGLVIPAALIDGEYMATHRPSGRTCAQCQHTARDCSRLDFAAMRPAGRPDADGIPTLDECRVIVVPLIDAIKRRTGHPPGMLQDDSRELTAWLSGKPDAMRHARDAVAKISADRRPCRCGPDGCAYSGCAGRVANEAR